MTNFSKIEGRLLLQSRMQKVSLNDLAALHTSVLGQTKKLLVDAAGNREIKKVLIFQPIPKYREFDLSPLETIFPEYTFDKAPQSSDGGFPSALYDVIFVPLYGYNSDNFRLGHGGGWYDKFLELQPQAIKVGVGLGVGMVAFEPETHDIPMDIIITEESVPS